MKQIQVVCTIDVTNDEYSALLNKQSGITIETIVYNLLEDGESDKISFDFPAVLLDLPTNESVS